MQRRHNGKSIDLSSSSLFKYKQYRPNLISKNNALMSNKQINIPSSCIYNKGQKITSSINLGRESFVGLNCRIYLYSDRCGNGNCSRYKNCDDIITNFDRAIYWNNMALVDMLYPDDEDFVQCPICLESDLVSPRITRCGHIFCWPCILRNIYEKDLKYLCHCKCPICFSSVILKELVPVRFQPIRVIKCGSTTNLCLLFREQSEPVAYLKSDYLRKIGLKKLLCEEDSGVQFQRICLLNNRENLLRNDLLMLESKRFKIFEDSELENLEDELFYIDECINIVRSNFKDFDQITYNKHNMDNKGHISIVYYNENELAQILATNDSNRYSVSTRGSFSLSPTISLTQSSEKISSSSIYYFYQTYDGQLCFLDPFYLRILCYEYGDIEDLPPILTDVLVIGMKELVLVDNIRKQYKYLNHLQPGSKIFLLHIDITPFIKDETKQVFKKELYRRYSKLKSGIKTKNQIIGDEAHFCNKYHLFERSNHELNSLFNKNTTRSELINSTFDINNVLIDTPEIGEDTNIQLEKYLLKCDSNNEVRLTVENKYFADNNKFESTDAVFPTLVNNNSNISKITKNTDSFLNAVKFSKFDYDFPKLSKSFNLRTK
ncbi:uncharacterized protein CMU_013040 [Cryptosporidium muris RN66]|uniref:RING-type domain-containing protein n=1 Tax=Cryptosporidium muris (strain RN66) TaxID=441375 RepID=B6AEL3_CRYMR|nr:uncharacterized protein CMU_013040 [Cryptosporidium muris RN66]EEA06630.1 hypothetical protein, conserved [Cryptosporidium muris RN66]|eukprot:XP_002140979.1 hypothetical protein [Cryptosporidium muris RN66]